MAWPWNKGTAGTQFISPTEVLWKLMRGTAETHGRHPFVVLPGNFTLVLDVPELRYHDGKAPGGVPIPLPDDVHRHLLAQYGR